MNKVERFVIDDNTIALELTETRIWPARQAREQGYAVEATGGNFAVRRRCAVVIPFDESGLIEGEMNYGFGWAVNPLDFEAVHDSDLSEEYAQWLKTLEETTA